MKKDMYNIIASAILIIVVSLLASSCKIHIDKREEGGKTITSNYDIKTPFKGITTTTNVDIIYTVSDSIGVKVEGPENFVNKLTVTVSADSMLCISSTRNDVSEDFMEGLKNGFEMSESDEIKVYISGPAPSVLDFNGATEFTAKDTISVPSMMINVSGAADIDIKNVVADSFKAQTSGSAEIKIGALKAETAQVETSGAGDVKIGFVGVKNTNFTSSGASKAEFNFTDCDTASLNIMGAAEVELKGTLRHLDKNIAGAGEIDDDELKVEE